MVQLKLVKTLHLPVYPKNNIFSDFSNKDIKEKFSSKFKKYRCYVKKDATITSKSDFDRLKENKDTLPPSNLNTGTISGSDGVPSLQNMVSRILKRMKEIILKEIVVGNLNILI